MQMEKREYGTASQNPESQYEDDIIDICDKTSVFPGNTKKGMIFHPLYYLASPEYSVVETLLYYILCILRHSSIIVC